MENLLGCGQNVKKASKLIPGVNVPLESSFNVTETLSRDEKLRIVKQRCGVYESHKKSSNNATKKKRRKKK